MKVSIVIPTYDRPKFLLRAINSVIAQTEKDWELLIVDDNGINTTAQIETERVISQLLVDSRIRYLKHEKNKGGCAARNTGIKNSSGELLAFLDDDDEWGNNFLENFLKKIGEINQNNSSGFAIYCNNINEINGRATKPITHKITYYEGDVHEHLLRGWCPSSTSLFIVAKQCFDSVGMFDENLNSFQDYDMWLRISKEFKFYHIDEYLVIKHDHDFFQVSKNPETRIKGFNKIKEKWGAEILETIGEKGIAQLEAKHLAPVYFNTLIQNCKNKEKEKSKESLSLLLSLEELSFRYYIKSKIVMILGYRAFSTMIDIKRSIPSRIIKI